MSERVLGIDYGTRRIGLALSDPEGRMAFPHRTVRTLPDVARAVEELGVRRIVIGIPTAPWGASRNTERAVRRFAARLSEAVQLPIEFEDERFTTKIAERGSGRARADAAAAALILQSYLDRCTRSRTAKG